MSRLKPDDFGPVRVVSIEHGQATVEASEHAVRFTVPFAFGRRLDFELSREDWKTLSASVDAVSKERDEVAKRNRVVSEAEVALDSRIAHVLSCLATGTSIIHVDRGVYIPKLTSSAYQIYYGKQFGHFDRRGLTVATVEAAELLARTFVAAPELRDTVPLLT